MTVKTFARHWNIYDIYALKIRSLVNQIIPREGDEKISPREIRSGNLSRHGRKVLAGTDHRSAVEAVYRPDGKSANCFQGLASTSRGWRRAQWPNALDSGQETLFWRWTAHPFVRSPTRKPSK